MKVIYLEFWSFENQNKLKLLTKNKMDERIYHLLLYEILSGEYVLGERILINQLTQKYDVSTTPIREALSKLENDGLLIKEPYKSYSVKEFSIKEIEELYEARIILETEAIKLATKRINDEQKEEFQKILNDGLKYSQNKNYGKFNKNNAEFHFHIFKTSANNYLYNMMKSIYKQIMLLTFKSFSSTDRIKFSLKEHKEIFYYIKNNNKDQAIKLGKKHLNKSLNRVKKLL